MRDPILKSVQINKYQINKQGEWHPEESSKVELWPPHTQAPSTIGIHTCTHIQKFKFRPWRKKSEEMVHISPFHIGIPWFQGHLKHALKKKKLPRHRDLGIWFGTKNKGSKVGQRQRNQERPTDSKHYLKQLSCIFWFIRDPAIRSKTSKGILDCFV